MREKRFFRKNLFFYYKILNKNLVDFLKYINYNYKKDEKKER